MINNFANINTLFKKTSNNYIYLYKKNIFVKNFYSIMKKIVLIRHGESRWNKLNRFTGWTDVALSEKGIIEAQKAGKLLQQEGYSFDIAYTSILQRAIKTLWLILEEMHLMWIPTYKHWELNEKHYGKLQGLNKAETAKKYGDEQVLLWRRGFDVRPPAFEPEYRKELVKQPPFIAVPEDKIPLTESLKDTIHRVLPFWNNEVVPQIKAGKKIIIAAHGNSLRAIYKHLTGISEAEILKTNIPTGVPLVFEINDDLTVNNHYYLGDPETIRKMQEKVANQGKSK